jgi:ribosomal protein S18 acetylase RimI-like enzyme
MTYPTEAALAIRPAKEADSEKLQALFQENDRHFARLLPGDFRAVPVPRPRRAILDWIAERNGLLLVCDRGGEIVGCLRASLELPASARAAKPARTLKVHDLIVSRRMRNSGIGSALMAEAESWARRRRARRVQLEVLARNHEAVSFCDELGFETLSASLEKRI